MARPPHPPRRSASGPSWPLGAAVLAVALGAAHYMEEHGHVVTGMNEPGGLGPAARVRDLPHRRGLRRPQRRLHRVACSASRTTSRSRRCRCCSRWRSSPAASWCSCWTWAPGAPRRRGDALQLPLDLRVEHDPLQRALRHLRAVPVGAPRAALPGATRSPWASRPSRGASSSRPAPGPSSGSSSRGRPMPPASSRRSSSRSRSPGASRSSTSRSAGWRAWPGRRWPRTLQRPRPAAPRRSSWSPRSTSWPSTT